MNILFACSELYPLIKTGGLADVAYNLPAALRRQGHDIRIVLPSYSGLAEAHHKWLDYSAEVMGYPVGLLQAHLKGTDIPVYLVDCPQLFDRPGGPYGEYADQPWTDNAQRFGLFCRVSEKIALNQVGLAWHPDTVHCNDWHTGLLPLLLASHNKRPQCLFTIHNLAYQGLFDRIDFEALDLPATVDGKVLWDYQALEYYGMMSFMKAGIVFADAVNTVSVGYAKEVLSKEFGCGLEGLLRSLGEGFSGITNGIDTQLWDPSNDPMIQTIYGSHSLHRKVFNKLALLAEFQLLGHQDRLLLGIVSRLTEQKGIDLLIEALPLIMQLPVDLVVLGNGDKVLEKALLEVEKQYPMRISVKPAYDERAAHLVIAGADALLIPSRYEPCGLTQMYAQRYGTIPVAHGVGGLADTIIDIAPFSENIADSTGVLFWDFTPDALIDALQRLHFVYDNLLLWRDLQRSGMDEDFSWDISATGYSNLYQSLISQKY